MESPPNVAMAGSGEMDDAVSQRVNGKCCYLHDWQESEMKIEEPSCLF